MKQPGLDGRHRDKDGKIDQKHGNTMNKNLPKPIEGFGPNTTLKTMRDKLGAVSEKDLRAAVAKKRER